MSDVEELTTLVRPGPGQGMGAGQVKTWPPHTRGPPLTYSCEVLLSTRNAS